jgi:hypothetical protein
MGKIRCPTCGQAVDTDSHRMVICTCKDEPKPVTRCRGCTAPAQKLFVQNLRWGLDTLSHLRQYLRQRETPIREVVKMLATMADAHREWHSNTGVPMGTPGCPQDACHPIDDAWEDVPVVKCGHCKERHAVWLVKVHAGIR